MVDDTLGPAGLGDLIATLGSIDDDEIDWQNVARTTVLIHQTYRYEYPGPIAALRQRLMVVPPDYHDDQRLVTHKLRATGCNVDTERSYDTFGNVVLDLTLQCVEREVEFTSWIVVEREAGVDGAHYSEPLAHDSRFAEPSRLTRPDNALAAAFLIFSFVGTGVSFLAFAAIAARRAMITERYGVKSIYYLGGLAEGTETILVFAAMAVRPDWFVPLAYGFGMLCWVTTALRVWRGAILLRDRPAAPHSAG